MDQHILHRLLKFGVDRGVSDIHFEVGYPPHYRLNGELLGAIKVQPLTSQDTESIAKMILGKREVDFNQRFGEIDVSYSLAGMGDSARAADGKTRGRDMKVDAGITMALSDMHEHLGQLIAYARMNRIVPPWSR